MSNRISSSSTPPATLGDIYLADITQRLQKDKSLADRAMAQIDDATFFAQLDEEANSIAVLVKHIAGNMRSRWQDFLTTDGEKPDRDRDSEFIITPDDTRAALMARWEANWQMFFATLAGLTGDDLTRTIYIRREPHTVVSAIDRQLSHYAYHIGQIVLLAKHAKSAEWKTLTIARGQSAQFNAQAAKQHTA